MRIRKPEGASFVSKPLRKAVLPVRGRVTLFAARHQGHGQGRSVVDKPLIQYAIEEQRAAGIEQFCMVTGRGKTALVEHFDIAFELESTLRERGREPQELDVLRDTQVEPGSIVTVRQQVPLGLGHAILVPPCVYRRRSVRDFVAGRSGAGGQTMSEPACRRLRRRRRQCGRRHRGSREQTNRYGILRTGKDDGCRVEVLGWSRSRRRRTRHRTYPSSGDMC